MPAGRGGATVAWHGGGRRGPAGPLRAGHGAGAPEQQAGDLEFTRTTGSCCAGCRRRLAWRGHSRGAGAVRPVAGIAQVPGRAPGPDAAARRAAQGRGRRRCASSQAEAARPGHCARPVRTSAPRRRPTAWPGSTRSRPGPLGPTAPAGPSPAQGLACPSSPLSAAPRSAGVCPAKGGALREYGRSSPLLVFSLLPRCQGACGSSEGGRVSQVRVHRDPRVLLSSPSPGPRPRPGVR